MKVHYLPLALIAGLAMQLTPAATASSTASTMVLRSPVTAQTYADNSLLWHQLRWLPGSNQLVATITLSNMDYVSRVEPRHDETFNFPLPGVKFAPKTGTFYVSGSRGEAIPVAVMHPDIIGHSIELLPTARLLITNRSGHLTVRLLSNQPVSDGPLWVER